MTSILERTEVPRGDLTDFQISVLDSTLRSHGLPESSPYRVPSDTLAHVCLACGSIAECKSREQRDLFVETCVQVCCGLTVVFHSEHRLLVDPDTLGEPRREVST